MEMKMARWVLLLVALWLAPADAAAQTVEMVFTPAVLQQAVSLKGTLRAEKVESFSALALVGASPARKKAYGDKVANTTAVVILGEDALKAVADVEFTTPVILLNATGQTAAKGRVIRVFDGTSAPAAATAVASAAAVKGLLGSEKEVALKGAASTVIQGILDALK
jgi:hypothetical protein